MLHLLVCKEFSLPYYFSIDSYFSELKVADICSSQSGLTSLKLIYGPINFD